MKNFLPLSIPIIDGKEKEYVNECLETGWVSSAGKFVDRFENEISSYTKSAYSIACMNGTSALHTSLILSGVEVENEVIVPSLTFIAPINAVKYLGAYPIFMDSDDDFNIDINKTISFLLDETDLKDIKGKMVCINKKTKRQIKALVVVHIFGNTVLMDDLLKICEDRNIKIIEDASESLGSKFAKGKYENGHSGIVGHFGCLSFNGNKIITCGSGGMILTQDKVYAEKAKYLTTQAKDDIEKFIHNEVGYNYRMSNVQAAIGCAQLESLDKRIKKKRIIHKMYLDQLEETKDFEIHQPSNVTKINFWLMILKIKNPSINPLNVMEQLNKQKIETRPIWQLNHLQKPYEDCQNYKIEKSYDLLNTSLCIPSSPDIDENDIARVVRALSA
jgi:perosamine synthetase